MEKGKLEELLNIAIFASIEAGKEIMKIYSSNFDIELKDDNSPVKFYSFGSGSVSIIERHFW